MISDYTVHQPWRGHRATFAMRSRSAGPTDRRQPSQTGAADSINVSATLGGGVSITVPASSSARTLSVYVGGSNDTGMLQASLSDSCVSHYIATASNGRNSLHGRLSHDVQFGGARHRAPGQLDDGGRIRGDRVLRGDVELNRSSLLSFRTGGAKVAGHSRSILVETHATAWGTVRQLAHACRDEGSVVRDRRG